MPALHAVSLRARRGFNPSWRLVPKNPCSSKQQRTLYSQSSLSYQCRRVKTARLSPEQIQTHSLLNSYDWELTRLVGIIMPIFSIALPNSSASIVPLLLRSKYLKLLTSTVSSLVVPLAFWDSFLSNSFSKLPQENSLVKI